ncbi:LacI family DNA-binding transcriptional regulator [Galbitalea sp. SE-J8]|uniref:LacI family DNA-binding transcriptional regulator n=1 Tax=Galbitalea sp. SE-J8 TaxID=3054952 RepID=UPI00259CEF3F|nr:LacI family DNA-binding transcriptional regulator [Galbitalea sp. SE-J8]MDM4763873.1 LacI family DNA-binding transcriptional regulator [Galbitalea sp. SE-J8]
MAPDRMVRATAPTLEDVASAAGVSRSTASRVINGSPHVSPTVVRAVHDAIDRLDYVPNRAARSLANRRTGAIALVVPEDTTRFFGDPYFSAVMRGISEVLHDSDYVLTLQLAHEIESSAKTIRYLRGGNVDAALIVSHHAGDHILDALGGALPVVFGGRPIADGDSGAYYVDVDNTDAARRGVQHLIDSGRERIAHIAGPADMPAGVDRLEGWRLALDGAGLDATRVVHGDFSRSGGSAAMRLLLERFPDLDAVFAASDLTAFGAMSVLAGSGIRVPRDVAVLGFDDSPAAAEHDVPLTTVRQPAVDMGRRMATMAIDLLAGREVPHRAIMDTEVVVRASA